MTQKPRILIVDDDEMLLFATVRAFRMSGYQVQEARDGQTALAGCIEFKPDLILMDVLLPDMSGLDLCQHVKSIPELRHTIVLLISGHATTSDYQIDGLSKGADGYLIKPISNKELLARVDAYLRIKSAEDSFRAMDMRREELEKIINASRTVVVVYRHEDSWPVEFVSDGISQFGYAPADFYSGRLGYCDMIHRMDVERVREQVRSAVAEGRDELTNEYRITDQDGVGRWVDVRTHLRRDTAGNVIDIQAILFDVTEKKLADQARMESERRLRDIFENARFIAIMLDTQGRVTFMNDYCAELTGWSRQEMIGQNWFERCLPEDVRGAVQVTFQDLLQGQEHAPFYENEILDASGYRRWVRWSNIILREGSDSVVGTASLGEDISERKEAEQLNHAVLEISELAHSSYGLDELYRAIHAIISQLMPARNIYIALFDEQSDMLSFPYFVDEFDEQPEPYKMDRGLTAYVLRSGESLLTDPAILERLARQGEIDLIGTLSFNWLGIPLKTKDSTIGVLAVQSYSTVIQYTERHRDILFFVSEQIATAIESKRREEELREAKEKAVESSRIKSTLLANISHEFRTPMNGILGFAELLKMELESPEHQQMADVILSSGRRLLDTLETILTLSIVESDRARVQPQLSDLAKEALLVVETLRVDAEAKGLAVDVERLLPVHATVDRTLFTNIIRQLMLNAIKFTLTGGITVESALGDGPGGAMAVIKVRDTGIGISEEHHEMIFKEFRQVSEGYGRSYEGIGLGLTLCRKMTEMMGGHISFESAQGTGSTFMVAFPAVIESREEEEGEAEAAPPQDERPKEPHDLPAVLAVEDNEVNRDLINIYLRSCCRVQLVPDAETALVLAAREHFDVVLMDINLGPGMDGLTAAKLLRTTPGHADTPIVALTGYAAASDREQMLAGGCSHYLAKPFDRRTLLALLQDILQRRLP